MKSHRELQQDVMDELEWEPSADHARIGVSVVDGVAKLDGYVQSYAERLAAENAVKRGADARAIAEKLKVRLESDPKIADHEIARRIRNMFEWSSVVPSEEIQVNVEDGWVTLSGVVGWNYQRNEAVIAASAISGVKGISNKIAVERRPAASDLRHPNRSVPLAS